MGDSLRDIGSEALVFAQRRLNGALVLSVGGEVDLANVSSLESQLKAATAAAEALVVDLTHLRYIDSCGIKALLDARRASARGGRSIALAAVAPLVRRTFDIVRMEQAMPMFPTVEAAVEDLCNGDGAHKTSTGT